MILVLAIAAGLLVGWATGGSLRALSRLTLRVSWVALAALVAQSALRGPLGENVDLPVRIALWAVLTGTVLAVACVNWRIPGMPLVALGLALNLIVVVANVGMPVSANAVSSLSHGSVRSLDSVSGGFYHAETPATHLRVLGDILPVPGPSPVRTVLSLGDVALLLGVAIILARGMHAPSDVQKD